MSSYRKRMIGGAMCGMGGGMGWGRSGNMGQDAIDMPLDPSTDITDYSAYDASGGAPASSWGGIDWTQLGTQTLISGSQLAQSMFARPQPAPMMYAGPGGQIVAGGGAVKTNTLLLLGLGAAFLWFVTRPEHERERRRD